MKYKPATTRVAPAAAKRIDESGQDRVVAPMMEVQSNWLAGYAMMTAVTPIPASVAHDAVQGFADFPPILSSVRM